MNTRIWLLGLGALFTLTVVVLLAFGISTHKEVTLLHVCWYNGHAIYKMPDAKPDHGPCTQFEELVWPKSQIPLTISARPYAGPSLAEIEADTIRSVVSAINDRVGFEALRLVDSSDASIKAVLGVPVETGPAGGAGDLFRRRDSDLGDSGALRRAVFDRARGYCVHQRRPSSGHLEAELVLRSGGSPVYLFHLYYHELGHCMGLGHDDFQSSVMDPHILDHGWDGKMPLKLVRFTDVDRARLRALYH